jgi:hypothetical protein
VFLSIRRKLASHLEIRLQRISFATWPNDLQKRGVKKNCTEVCCEFSRNPVREIDCLVGPQNGSRAPTSSIRSSFAEDQKHGLKLFKINWEADGESLILAESSSAKKTTDPHL